MNANQFFNNIYTPDQQARMKPGTYFVRLSQIRCHFLPEFGEYELEDIQPVDIDGIYADMEPSFAQNTIFGTYAALRSFFALAFQLGIIPNDPATLTRIIRPDIDRK